MWPLTPQWGCLWSPWIRALLYEWVEKWEAKLPMHKPLPLHGRNWLKSALVVSPKELLDVAGAYPAVTTLQKPSMLQPAIPTWRMSLQVLTSVIPWMLRWVMKTYWRQGPHFGACSGGSRQLRWSKWSVQWSQSHRTDCLAAVCICSAGCPETCCWTGKGSGQSEAEDAKYLPGWLEDNMLPPWKGSPSPGCKGVSRY